VAIALKIKSSTSQGAIALAMVNLLDFGQTLTIFIGQWTELETSLGAIARLKLFVQQTPIEDKAEEAGSTASDWPAHGAIAFEEVTAAYSEGGNPVLHDISIRIAPGQKVAICGRSGG
jgi:ABC-type multidrug transport system fused ATPase/permease subunit